jgi:tetratricopeptide (TPR) repeat protein
MEWVGNGKILRVGAFAFGLALAGSALSGRADDAKPNVKKPAEAGDAMTDELLKLNRATGKEAQKKALLAFVKDKAKAKKAVTLAEKMQKDAKGKDRPFNFGASMILGRAAHFVKEYDAAEYFLTQCTEAAAKLESGEKLVQSYDNLIDLYWDAKRFDDVIDTCEKFVELKGPEDVDRFKPFMLERLVKAKARQGKTDEAMRITEGLVQLDEGGFYFVQLKGWVQREAGKFDDAIETYTDALDKLDSTKQLKKESKEEMKDEVRYILSGLYVDIKDIPKAAKQLETLMKKHPDKPTYKNDLGFIWADNDMKLDESAKLIQEALDLDKKRQEQAKEDGKIDEVKETAAYLDSMGWVLFKQKKYQEALPYLKKAAADEEEGAHLEIWDHLGDLYMAMDNKKEAIAAWQKGLTMEDVSKRDIERRKAVTKKLRAAGAEPKQPEKKAAPKKKVMD